MALQLPARIGKYQLEEFLGGGMSHVYRAIDTVLGRTVARKILTEAGCADAEAKARFLAEARMAGNIVHDNIINVYDFGEEQGRPFIVMEFLRGESLKEAIKNNRPPDVRDKLVIARQISLALKYIHEKKIIHRDIKPENVHVDTLGKVKLMDFGIAKSEGLQLTRAGFTLGTPYYMAPEQVLGQQVTFLVDVYAFGVLLFEFLSGVKPITGDTVERIFNQILYEPLDLEPLRRAGVPQRIFDLVARCTVKDPAQRLQGFNVVAQEIETALAEPMEPARPAPPARSPISETPAPARPVAAVGAVGPPPSQPAVRAVKPPPAPGDLPGFLSILPPKLRTQQWLMVFAAGAVLLGLGLLYVVVSLVAKIV
jgi:serine/threonine protein kinase